MAEYESSKTGELAFSIATRRAVTTHQMLRSAAGLPARRELCFRLHKELGWSFDGIDRNWGFPMGTAQKLADEYTRPRLVSSVEVVKVVTVEEDRRRQRELWDAAQRRSQQLAEQRILERKADKRSEFKDRMKQSALDREQRKRDERAVREKDRLEREAQQASLSAQEEAKRDAADEELRKQRQAEIEAMKDQQRPSIPRCQQDRGGRICGAVAIAWTLNGEHACVYCAMQSRKTG